MIESLSILCYDNLKAISYPHGILNEPPKNGQSCMEGRNDRSHEEQKQEEMEAVRRYIIAVRCSWCVYLLWRDGQQCRHDHGLNRCNEQQSSECSEGTRNKLYQDRFADKGEPGYHYRRGR